MRVPGIKIGFIVFLLVLYVGSFAVFQVLIAKGILHKEVSTRDSTGTVSSINGSEIPFNLLAAQVFVQDKLVHESGHIDLYYVADPDLSSKEYRSTNSEAVSYFLLWNAQALNRQTFNRELDYIEENMLEPKVHYMMWRLEQDDSVVRDGSNIASDADLRAIKSLLKAEEQWKDKRYTRLIDTLATALEKVAINDDHQLVPYGGINGEKIWRADEVWLSYSDFTVFNALALRRGEPWISVYKTMKEETLKAQIPIGFYNSQITKEHTYTHEIDGKGYSINSLWIMVRNAESGDRELVNSAKKALDFYEGEFNRQGKIFSAYSAEGIPLDTEDPPWVYALVGRAAIALNNGPFAVQLARKVGERQITNTSSPFYGSIPEGTLGQQRVGQFTMQESIITMQAYLDSLE